MRASSPSVELAGVIRRQIDRHVNVVEIEDRENPLPCRDHLAGASEPVLHASGSGRDERQVGKNGLELLDIGLRLS